MSNDPHVQAKLNGQRNRLDGVAFLMNPYRLAFPDSTLLPYSSLSFINGLTRMWDEGWTETDRGLRTGGNDA